MLENFIVALFVLLLGLRPFLSSLAFPQEDIIYSLLFILASLCLMKKNAKSLRSNPAFYPLVIFVFAILMSISFSKNTDLSLSQFYKYSAYLMAFLSVSCLSDKKKKLIILCLLTSCSLVSFFALQWLLIHLFETLDFLRLHHQMQGFGSEYLSRGRAFVPFVTPTALGGYLILLTPLSIAFLFQKRYLGTPWSPLKLLINSLVLLAVILNCLALLSTQSLGAVLSLTIAVFLFIFFHARKIQKNSALVCIAVFLISGMIILALRNSNKLFFNVPSFSVTNRLSYWGHAVILIFQHPWAGLGLGNYPFFKSISPHNSYLQIWAETGILGLAGLLAIAYQTLAVDFSKMAEHERKTYQALWIGNLAFLIHNMIDFTFFLPEAALSWWVVTALLSSQRIRKTP